MRKNRQRRDNGWEENIELINIINVSKSWEKLKSTIYWREETNKFEENGQLKVKYLKILIILCYIIMSY